jgi:DNA-binding CsgD family transcriptional regulator
MSQSSDKNICHFYVEFDFFYTESLYLSLIIKNIYVILSLKRKLFLVGMERNLLKYSYLITQVLLLLLVCGNSSRLVGQAFSPVEYRKSQEKVYKLIFVEPTKARKEIDLLLKNRQNVPDTLYGMNWNMLGIYYGVNNFLDSAHFALDQAISILPEGFSRRMAIMNNKAIIYRKQKNYEKGMQLLEMAEKDAVKYGDSLMLGTIIGEKSSYFSAQNMYSAAATHLLQSIAILERIRNAPQLNLYKEKQKLANLYFKMADYTSAQNMYLQILPFFESQKELDTYFVTLVNLGDVYIHQNKLDSASVTLQKALKGLMSFPNQEMQIHATERIAHLENLRGNKSWALDKYRQIYKTAVNISSPRLLYYATEYARALYNQKKAAEIKSFLNQLENMPQITDNLGVSTNEEKHRYHEAIGNLFVFDGQSNKGAAHLQSALILQDSAKNENDFFEAKNIKWKYQAELKDKENQLLFQQNQVQRLLIILVAFLLVLFTSFLIWKWYLNQASLKIKTVHVEALAREKILLNEKLAAEQELGILKEQIINEHRSDLMVKNIENIRLNQQIADMLKKLEEGENNPNQNKSPLFNSLEQEHWDDIILKFKQLNPDFVKKLQKHGENLSKGDIEFCSMVRMNMSNKDIARILNISLESVRTKKYRLMKKLNMPDDDNFYQWVITL